MVQSIFEIENGNDVRMYVWFIHSWIKDLKKKKCKKRIILDVQN